MRNTANRRIAVKAYAADRLRKRNFGLDMGGGSGRIGTRIQPVKPPSKGERLRHADS